MGVMVANVWSQCRGVVGGRLFNRDVRDACIAKLFGGAVSDGIVSSHYMAPSLAAKRKPGYLGRALFLIMPKRGRTTPLPSHQNTFGALKNNAELKGFMRGVPGGTLLP